MKVSRYNRLSKYLHNLETERVELNFDQVEQIVGALPQSAKKFRQWWANDLSHSQARFGWLSAGWKVDYVHIEKRTVTFCRSVKPCDMGDELKKFRAFSSSAEFHVLARYIISREILKVDLLPYSKNFFGTPFELDFMSADGKAVCEALFTDSVLRVSEATLARISERVWLLEKVKAERKLIVFGGGKEAPLAWLQKHGKLVENIEFYFVEDDGKVTTLMGR